MTLRIESCPSPNFNERKRPLDMLVLHYTGMNDGPTALARMCDPATEVSAHYMVEENGRILGLVDEAYRAWHAGRGSWQGDDDLNSHSIGIEIVNGGHDFGLPPYPDTQINAVIELCQAIQTRWQIPQSRIVAHSDIAPERKQDPGEMFPWARLAAAGVGLWPDAPKMLQASFTISDLKEDLRSIGYAVPPGDHLDNQTRCVLSAFQRRWRANSVSGEPDSETVSLVHAVAELKP